MKNVAQLQVHGLSSTAGRLRRSAVTAALAGLAVWSLSGAALAQTPAPAAATAEAPAVIVPKNRPEQAIERIHTEDAGTRIDELRVGGETQSITVQPKTGRAPAYEVKQPESARGAVPAASNGDTNGSRVWNVMKF